MARRKSNDDASSFWESTTEKRKNMSNDIAFDQIANAAGKLLVELAQRANRDEPSLHALIDALLNSGESFTNVNIRIFDAGIQVRATINNISDGAEQALLGQVDGVVPRLQ